MVALLMVTIMNDAAQRSIGIVGLGKMGGGIARHALQLGFRVVGFDKKPAKRRAFPYAKSRRIMKVVASYFAYGHPEHKGARLGNVRNQMISIGFACAAPRR